ncbi:hypothetical protein JF714_15655 [Mycobacterium avium]|uniref:hypothetical protein n=1 Tax=Mycobacterium avium TaxID=1764 RepID=UPI001CDADD4F|nr:hypothetical protein [Mycobacterium avium]MCA2331878.1 hypothetical protein [Mycobacterium avium]
MTFHVVTPEHGEHQFDADGAVTLSGENGDEGNLWLSKDGVGVAEFAKGAWLFVYVTEDPAPEPKPKGRRWDQLSSVPKDVKVTDRTGSLWEAKGGEWGYWSRDWYGIGFMESFNYNHLGPFIEVLDK